MEVDIEESKDTDKVCCFKDVLESCKMKEQSSLLKLQQNRLTTLEKASRKRKDKLDLKNQGGNLFAHKECLLEYTSNDHIQRHKRKIENSENTIPAKRTRSSDTAFDFKQHCLFCGKKCDVEPDPKNPERWKKNKGMLCRAADRGPGLKSVKDYLFEVSNFIIFRSCLSLLFKKSTR